MQFVAVQLRRAGLVLLLRVDGGAAVLPEKLCLQFAAFVKLVRPLTALPLPPSCMARSCSHVQLVSNCVDRTNDRCTPSPRCTAEQSMQMNTPYVTDDHVGLFAPQSKQHYNIAICDQPSSHLIGRLRAQLAEYRRNVRLARILVGHLSVADHVSQSRTDVRQGADKRARHRTQNNDQWSRETMSVQAFAVCFP